MARGTVLTRKVEDIITETYLNHPELRAKPNDFHNKVYARVHEDWLADSNWPGLSAVKKRLLKLRRYDEARSVELKELDKPWRISTLVKHPISSEALPIVLERWVNREKEGKPLTIREAKWVARLYPIFKAYGKRLRDENLAMSMIEFPTRIYALHERIAELTGVEARLTGLDLLMWQNMTGKIPSSELLDRLFPKETTKLLHFTPNGLRMEITEDELGFWRDAWPKLGYGDFDEACKRGTVSFEILGDTKAIPPVKKGGSK